MKRYQLYSQRHVSRIVSTGRRVVVAALALTLTGAGSAHAIPEITSASGCDASGSGAGTVNCPTRTGTLPQSLTINGISFVGAGAHAFVGGAPCDVVAATDNSIVCELPDGSGKNVDIVVTDPSGIPSLPARLVDFAPPAISSVGGCSTNSPDGRSTGDCARSGGTLLTITGSNFTDAARVYVGSEECGSPSSDDDQIICTLPAGKGTDKPVLVVVANQLSAGTAYKVSYAQCPPGTSDEGGLTCTNCDADEFSSSYDSSSCEPCPAGTFSASGDAACTGPSGYQCWQAKDLKTPRFTPIEALSISDSLDADAVVDVKKPVIQCRAATTGAAGEAPPAAGFTCYQIKGDKLDPPVQVSVTDPGGSEIDLSLESRKLYCGSTDHF